MFNVLAIFGIDDIYFWYLLASVAISYTIAELSRKKAKGPEDALPGKPEAPIISEGKTFPVVFGMPKRIESPLMAWWGDTQADAIWDRYKEPHGLFNNKDKWYVSGYQYRMGVYFILCHGPIDSLEQIHVGEKRLWPHNKTLQGGTRVTHIQLKYSRQTKFYGGDSRGGGFKGNVGVRYGEADQTQSSYMVGKLGADVSAYRGLVSVELRKIRIGHSPYPGRWSFTVKRTLLLDDGSEQWYVAKANIDNDLNPIHILRECYTNTRWGLGYAESLFSSVIWEAAADTLYDEDFGLSFLWDKDSDSIEEFVIEVLRHINGLIYQDPQTGNIVIKLIRDDYNADTLDVYDESDVLEINDLVRPSLGEIPNVYLIIYSDISTNKTASLPDQDIALIAQQGGKLLPITFIYAGITKKALAGKVLARDRHQVTSMSATMKLKCKRTMSSLLPGDVFKLTSSSHNFSQKIVRVLPNAKYGTLQDNRISLQVMEDIFAAQESLFAEPPDSDWEDPITDPVAATSFLAETPFWDLVQSYGKSLALVLDEASGFLQVGAVAPSDDSINYELLMRNGLTLPFNSKTRMVFTPGPLIAEEMPMNAVEMELSLDEDLEGITAGSYAVIDEEIVKVTVDINSAATQTVFVARGCLDTVPAEHSIGTRMWFVGTVSHIAADELTDGDQPGVKILTLSGGGQLDATLAPIDNADVFDSRHNRPYPPGNFLINGESYPEEFDSGGSGVTVSWAHRDRLLQLNYIVEHDEGDIGPELGVTYTLKIYDEDNVLCHTETGIEGTSYEYTEAHEISDCGELQDQLRFVLYSVRDDV